MTPINYFKLQAKNLYRDFKTQQLAFDSELQINFYEYEPHYFDIIGILLQHDFNEDSFKLMNAQHLIARFAGFDKWTTLQKAKPLELKLAKLLFDSMHKIHAEEWNWYLSTQERENNIIFDDETRLEIFTEVFYEVEGHESDFPDFRLIRLDLPDTPQEKTIHKPKKKIIRSNRKIEKIPLNNRDRKKIIDTANKAFERVLKRIEPENLKLTIELWDAERFVDNEVLKKEMLPIDWDYALSLADAFMVGHAIQLAVQADQLASKK